MVAEDDVDLESLQAQIDMTMSFAHNLVTSWINPTHLAQLSSSGINATQILEEELRRPPRLGVGASIPTAPPLAHEASKLKRRLGKHGAKNEGVMESQPQDSLKSDDEEYKGRPTKRKMKVDPFGLEGSKKKRKADSITNTYPSSEDVSNHSISLLENSSVGKPQNHGQGYPPCPTMLSSNRTLPDASSRKEKQRMGQDHQLSYVTKGQQSATLVSSLSVRLPVQTTFSPSLTAPAPPPFLEPTRETSAPVPENPTTTESSRVRANSMPIRDKAKPLGIPLLNLDGPPELTDKPGNTSKLNNSRRKRKRRKKKKTQMSIGTGDNSH